MSSLIKAVLVSVVDWFTLGVYLGVKYHTLEEIRIDHSEHASHCTYMLIAWLRNSEDTCTKHQLSIALGHSIHLKYAQCQCHIFH